MRREANQRENSRNVCSVVVACSKWSWSTFITNFCTLLKTLWAMKRDREFTLSHIHYNSPISRELQKSITVFCVKCFTYETENIDTQAIDIAGWVCSKLYCWMHLWFTSKNVPRSKNTLFTKEQYDRYEGVKCEQGRGAPHANKLRMSRNFLRGLGAFYF